MVLSESAVLPLCPWGGGSLPVTPLPAWTTRKAPTTIAAITSRLRMAASVIIGGAVPDCLALQPDAEPGPAHGERHRREQGHDEQGPERLDEHRPPEPRRRVRRHPELEQGRGARAEVRPVRGQLPGGDGNDVTQVGAGPGAGGYYQFQCDADRMVRRELHRRHAGPDPGRWDRPAATPRVALHHDPDRLGLGTGVDHRYRRQRNGLAWVRGAGQADRA